MRTSWADNKCNVDILKEIYLTKRNGFWHRRRLLTFFGHAMRRGELEHIKIRGKLEGKGDREDQNRRTV